MSKKGVRIAQLKVNNGSVVIYYSHKGITRYPTGITIDKKKKGRKYIEWDYKNNHLQPFIKDYHTRRDKVDFWLKSANDILEENFKEDGSTLSAAELNDYLTNVRLDKEQVNTSLFLSVYKEFHEQKKERLAVLGNPISLKDYTSFMNLISDYEKIHQKKIRIKDVNVVFVEKLHIWMAQKLEKEYRIDGNIYKPITKGGLNAKTIRKRFDTFKEFMKYLQDKKGLINSYTFLSDYVKNYVPNHDATKVTLTIKEVFKLYDYKFESIHLDKIKDLFVFACLTGMRWGDLEAFDSKFIIEQSDGRVYKRKANKTKNSSNASIQVPLCPTVIEILEKYDYKLSSIMTSNVNANRYVKEALKTTGYFDDIVEIVDKETGQYLRKYDTLSMHKGRDTFVSNLINVTPLNELMQYTGHSKLSTLQKYIDKNRPVHTNYVNEVFKR